jgi:NADH-quinone oxidoreductase subunit N
MTAIIAATIIGVLLMFVGITTNNKSTVVSVAVVLLVALLGVNMWEMSKTMHNGIAVPPRMYFNNMLRFDTFSVWFNLLMTGCTLLYALLLGKEIKKVGMHVAEYFALVSFILVGLYLLSSYNNMLMLFMGIEILSIPQYILAGSDKRNLKSSEASLKYFLMGAFTTGILLMGITLIYGSTGTFYIDQYQLLSSAGLNPMVIAGIVLLIIAFGFKVSAAPMHMWTPDVYDGAPTPFTAFMSTIVKAGAFVGFLRLFQGSFGQLSEHWMMLLAIITAVTLFVGNITAVFQQSVKRMLAYSSIAQAGFMLFAVISVNAIAWQSMIIYAVAYSVATIGMFAVLIKMKDYTYDGFNGLAKREPVVAFFTTIFLLSLAGIPLTGGFMAKYMVLLSAVRDGNLMWLVIFGLLMAAISAYYYFRVIIAMYFKNGAAELNSEITATDKLLLAITCVLVILIGVAPGLFLGL